MKNQKHLFALDPEVHYLNGASYSPSLISSLEKAKAALDLKGVTPFKIRSADHFETADRVRRQFCHLLDAPVEHADRVAVVTAVSYGMATVAANLHRLPGLGLKTEILLVGEEFPNNVYAFERVCEQHSLAVRTVERPTDGTDWSLRMLENIRRGTAMVVAPQIHWIHGTRFDLEAIGRRCREVGALLVLDLTQSLGIMPFQLEKVQPDAIVCASYKWLLGPYGLGLAWFGEFFDGGVPVEEGWMNRAESEVFSGLIRYLREYRPAAQRYNAGEFSQFAHLPMAEDALRQIIEWTPEAMQQYATDLTAAPVERLRELGCKIEKSENRAAHLLAVGLPPGFDAEKFMARLAENRVFVAVRGSGIRVATNVYNLASDWDKLVDLIGRS